MSAEITLSTATWLGIGLEAAEAGNRPRALSALMSIDALQWEAVRERLADPLFVGLAYTVPATGDFDAWADRAIAIVTGPAPAAGQVLIAARENEVGS